VRRHRHASHFSTLQFTRTSHSTSQFTTSHFRTSQFTHALVPLRLHLNGYKRVSGDFYVSICIRQKLIFISIGCGHRLHHSLPGHKMETDDLVCAVSSVVVALVARRKRRRLRSCWVRDWLHKRPQHATHVSLLSSLRSSDPSTYRNFLPDGP